MNTPGFWIKNDIFFDDECDAIISALRQGNVRRSRAGAPNLMSIAAIRNLAEDERLVKICEEITGSRLVPYKATLFEKTGKANWLVTFHQDTALPLEKDTNAEGWGPSSVKDGITFVHAPTWALKKILAVRIHLDPSTASNGPLRLIPNTHQKRIQNNETFYPYIKQESEVECLVGRGGIIAMSPLLVHASSKSINDEPRRVLHIEYAESLDLGEGIRLAVA